MGGLMIRRLVLVLALFLISALAVSGSVATSGQSTQVAEHLRNRIEAAGVPPKLYVGEELIYASSMLPKFYERRTYRPAWSSSGRPVEHVEDLLKAVRNADLEGLTPGDYHLGRIEATLNQIRQSMQKGLVLSPGILVDLDLLLTDAFLILGSHLLSGRVNPETIDSEWHAVRRQADLAGVLEKALDSVGIERSLAILLPPQTAYAGMREALKFYRKIAAKGGWSTVPEGPELVQGHSGERVAALARRLAATADLSPSEVGEEDLFDEAVDKALRRFQKRHGLHVNGVVTPATLSALNVSVEERIRQIELNMERWRWLPQKLGENHVMLNIANYGLDVVETGVTVMTLRAVVGRPYRRTPVFSDSITYVVFNPYWFVTTNIATQDILPILQKDPGYLTRKKIRVFKGWGSAAIEIDPATIDWSKITARNFPYALRQDPGSENALGQIVFRFPNKYNVYMHDTPARDLFVHPQRSFSSGCIRLENPIELAIYLLRGDANWQRKQIEEAIKKGKEQTVRLPKPTPTHLLYWTAWVDEDGIVQFRKDIYERDEHLYEALKEPAPSKKQTK